MEWICHGRQCGPICNKSTASTTYSTPGTFTVLEYRIEGMGWLKVHLTDDEHAMVKDLAEREEKRVDEVVAMLIRKGPPHYQEEIKRFDDESDKEIPVLTGAKEVEKE